MDYIGWDIFFPIQNEFIDSKLVILEKLESFWRLA